MKTRVIIVSLAVGAVLSGCSYSQQKPLATRVKASVGRRPSGRRITYQGNGLVRVPDQTHVYKVGRLPDGDSMREAGNYYHIEQSAYWNRFVQGGRAIVTNRVSVTSGPSETAEAKAYRMKEGEKSQDTDFSKIEGMSKQSKAEGLQPGPGSDD